MKKFVLIVASFFVLSTSFGMVVDSLKKKEISRNAVFAEFLGPGLLYSVNYEREFFTGQDFRFNYRIGESYYGKSFFGNSTFVTPISINGLIGKKRFFFVFGAGVTPILKTKAYNWPEKYPGAMNYYPKETFFFVANTGFRLHLKQFFLSIMYYPTLMLKYPGSYYNAIPYDKPRIARYIFGLNVGYIFNKKRK